MYTQVNFSLIEIRNIIGEIIDPLISKQIIESADVIANLNEEEINFINQNPYPSLGWAFCGLGGWMIGNNYSGVTDGKGDAMRHCFWAACMTQQLGNSQAKYLLDIHEKGRENNFDLHNNSVAMIIGATASPLSLWYECGVAAEDGRLQYEGSPSSKPNEPVSNPDNHPAKPSKPSAKPSAKPRNKPTAKPSAKPRNKPTAKPSTKPRNKPSAKPHSNRGGGRADIGIGITGIDRAPAVDHNPAVDHSPSVDHAPANDHGSDFHVGPPA